MTLERGEAGHRLYRLLVEGGNAIRDHLLGVGNDLEKFGPAKRLEAGALGLTDAAQVFIDLRG